MVDKKHLISRGFKNYLLILFVLLTNISLAQSDSIIEVPSNSFEKVYKTKYPNLHYSYNDLSQTHDYSNNWDFDGDGKNDSLFFIGNGGVHLYFHLQLRLSSDRQTYDFPFLAIDFLNLFTELELDNEGMPNIIQQFVVADFDDDKLPEIYINLDRQSKIPHKWEKKRLTSHLVIIDYSNGRLDLKNYTLKKQ
ncbi:MAG: VCBS repeat-containing protein [Flavobacterium sp.]|nr:VCBS repeat-containing protein [Flavobacterium sp.]